MRVRLHSAPATVQAVAIAAGYLWLGCLTLALASPTSGASPVWLSAGLGLAAMLLFNRRAAAVGVAAGSVATFALEFSGRMGPAAAIYAAILGLGATLEAWVACKLLDRYLDDSYYFSRYPRVLRFAKMVGLACLVGLVFRVPTGLLWGDLGRSDLLRRALIGLVADINGVLLLTPLLLAWHRNQSWDPQVPHWKLATYYVVVLVGASATFVIEQPGATALLFFAMLWACFRYGEQYSRVTALIIAAIASVLTSVGRGPFAVAGDYQTLNLQVYIFVIALTALTVKAGILRREHDHEALDADYRGVFDNAVAGIYRANPDGTLQHVNPALARMLGYDSPKQMIDMVKSTATGPFFAERGLRSQSVEKIEQDPHGELVIERVELRHRDGQPVWASQFARQLRDAAGRVRGYVSVLIDITKQINLFELSPVGISVSEIHGDSFIMVNLNLASMLGHGSPQEMIGAIRRISEDFYVDRDQRSKLIEELKRNEERKGEDPVRHRYRARRRGGGILWLEENARLIRTATGSPQILSVLWDVTPLVKSERQRSLAAKMGVALARRTGLGQVLGECAKILHEYAEPARTTIWVTSSDQLELQCAASIPERTGAARPSLRLLDPAGPEEREAEALRLATEAESRPGATGGDHRVIAFPIKTDDEFLGIILLVEPTQIDGEDDRQYVQDVVDPLAAAIGRERAEEQLRREKDRIETLARVAPVGIFEADERGVIRRMNPEARQLQGVPEGVPVDRWMDNLYPPEHRKEVLRDWNRFVASGAEEYSPSTNNNFKVGDQIRSLRVRSVALKDDRGAISGYLGTITDVTDIETHRQQQDLFLAHTGHDLKHSLAIIHNAATDLARERLEPALMQDVEDIRRAVQLLVEALGDALQSLKSGRWEAGEGEEFPLRSLVEFLIQARVVRNWKDYEIRSKIDPDLPVRVRGPKREMVLALQNLLANAARHCEGIVDVEVTYSRGDDGRGLVRFAIEDNGPGLTEAGAKELLGDSKRPDLAERYRKSTDYFGLGIALTQLYLKPYGSEVAIGVNSRHEGRWNRFWFELPYQVLPPSEGDSPPPSSPDEADFSGDGAVMLVEDDPKMRGQLARRLLAWHVQPLVVVSTGELAVAMARRFNFSLILMDLYLHLSGSEFDGYEAARRIRGMDPDSSRNGHPRPVILSISESDHDEGKLRRAGIDDSTEGKSFNSDQIRALWSRNPARAATEVGADPEPGVSRNGELDPYADRLADRSPWAARDFCLRFLGGLQLLRDRWKDTPRAAQLRHDLKGLARDEGFTRLADALDGHRGSRLPGAPYPVLSEEIELLIDAYESCHSA